MARIWIGARKQVEHLRRLAVVFAVPIRLKIVTELFQRDMSPTQFQKEFGGGSVSRVAKHFERLRDTGWLRLIYCKGPGEGRRGATETIYRATDLVLCDEETWLALPHSVRAAFSWNAYKEIAEQLRRAMEALTFQARPDRRLTCMRILLDELGWKRVAEATAQEFATQCEEQEDARRRVAHTEEELFHAASLLLALESPAKGGQRLGPRLAESKTLMVQFPMRVSKVFEDEVCLQIMDEANRGRVSVPTFHAKYGERLDLDEQRVRRRIKKLVKYGWLQEAGQQSGGRRRGGVEKFYEPTGPALYDENENGPWANVPDDLAKTNDWKTLARLSEWVKAAMVAGTIAHRDETCLVWSFLSLDQRGWEKVVVSLKALHAFVLREQKLARVRLAKSGEEPVVVVVALGAFEAAKPIREP